MITPFVYGGRPTNTVRHIAPKYTTKTHSHGEQIYLKESSDAFCTFTYNFIWTQNSELYSFYSSKRSFTIVGRHFDGFNDTGTLRAVASAELNDSPALCMVRDSLAWISWDWWKNKALINTTLSSFIIWNFIQHTKECISSQQSLVLVLTSNSITY